MWNKTTEYWIALVTLAIYVVARNAEAEPIRRRVIKTMVSAGLTLALSPTIAVYVHADETWAAVIIMSVGFMALDVFTSTVGSRAYLRSIIRSKLGGTDEKKP